MEEGADPLGGEGEPVVAPVSDWIVEGADGEVLEGQFVRTGDLLEDPELEHGVLDVVDVLAVPEGNRERGRGEGLRDEAVVRLQHLLQYDVKAVHYCGVH